MNDRNALSEREMEILRLVATGATNQEVAQRLIISVNTVKVHLRNIYDKLEVTSRTEATMVAVREGWVRVPGQNGQTKPAPAGPEEPAPVLPPAPPAPSALPVLGRWLPVSVPKRFALVAVLALAAAIVFLPLILESRANGERNDPMTGIFPTKSAGGTLKRWQTRAQMPTPRTHLAVVTHGDLVYAIGGVGNDGVVARVEVYDPEIDVWTARRSKPTPVGFVSAAVLGDQIYVPGGAVGESEVTDVLEVYDVVKDTWQRRASLPRALASYGLAAWNGQLYLFGGWDGDSYGSAVYRYDPQADEWSELEPMDRPRGLLGAATLHDRIYLVGGYDGTGESNACDVYDPATGGWSQCAAMARRRSGLALISVRDSLYAVGGSMTGYLSFNERYDSLLDLWVRIETPVMEQWLGPGLAFSFPYIYAIGGWNGATLSVNEAYQALFEIRLEP